MDSNLYDLIGRLQANDETAFEALKIQYEGLLHSQVSQAMGKIPGGEFDDLMQEATLALFHAAMRFDLMQDDVTFGLYAKICIRNRLVSVTRRASKSSTLFPSASIDEHLTLSERKAARRSGFRKLEDVAVEVLSSYEYVVYQLYLAGCSASEIARQLEKSPKSVDNAIYRMRKKIKEHCGI